MGSNTHEAFIQLPGGGHAFVSGIPDKCQHKWDGPSVLYTANDIRYGIMSLGGKYASMTDEFRTRIFYFHIQNKGDQVVEQTTTCSKCHKEYHPSPMDEDWI